MNYLSATTMLDYTKENIQALIKQRNWSNLSDKDKILQTYNYVRDEIKFGYNTDDTIPASKVISDGYGQCNTKGTLFMALLRGLGISCRMHGFLIDKKMQKGAIKGIYYRLAPKEIVHSWVEVNYNGQWFNLEGFILDSLYLTKLQKKFATETNAFCGFGVAIDDFQNPPIDWNENDTYIQKDGITKDLGIFATPDDFFKHYPQGLNRGQKVIYQTLVRHLMNRNVNQIRQT